MDSPISESDIGKIIISDFSRRYMEHVAERYRLIEDRNARVGEAVPLQKRYTKLLIVQKPRDEYERQHEIMSHGRKHAAMLDSLAHSKHYIHLDALFDSMEYGHRPRTVVLQGPAGIGKTMTAQKLMLDWARGVIYQGLFDYMFYLSCREINQVTSDTSVIDLIAAKCPNRKITMSALPADPSKILFIIDGFDELRFSLDVQEDQLYRDPWQENPAKVTLSNLLRRNILPGCTIIVTTRPAALERLKQCIKADLCAEIMGFTEADRKSYFRAFFASDEQASRALTVVQDNDTLYTMCFLPIVCWIVCTVLKQQLDKRQDITNSSKTTTSVYLFFWSTLLRDNSGASVKTMRRSLKKLCSLALNGIFEHKILFDEEDLRKVGLEVSDIQSLFLIQTIFQRDIDLYSAYSFIHLSFQEFFAALFYILDLDVGSLNPQRDLKQLLKEYSEETTGHLMLTVRFLFGLINKEHVRHLEKILVFLGYKISHSARDDLVAWLQEPKEERLLLEVFHCLHETQDEEITSRVMDNIQSIKITKYDYSIVNLKAISFCLKHCHGDKTLEMSDINFGPKAQQIMRPGLINCSTLRSDIYTVTSALIFEMQFDPPAKFLQVKGDPPMPWSRWKEEFFNYMRAIDGERMGSERKKSILLHCLGSEGQEVFRTLPQITVASGSGDSLNVYTEALSRLEKRFKPTANIALNRFKFYTRAQKQEESFDDFLTALRSLTLHCNFGAMADEMIRDQIIVHIRNKKIQDKLWCIGDPNLEETIAIAKSTEMSEKWMGIVDKQSSNPSKTIIEEEDISEQFWLECQDKDESLRDCGTTGVSCAALAAVLRSNRSLLELDLSQNDLGDAGATLLWEALKHPDTWLKKIRCGITGASCAALAAALRFNRSLLDLDLSYNLLGAAAATRICDALKHSDTRLQKINLNGCSITGASCAALAAVLRSNRSLLNLDLSQNDLGDAGATLLWDALKHPDTRLQRIRLRSCGITGASCAALAAVLRSNRSLLELDLSFNPLGDAGATLIIDTLQHPNTRAEEDQCPALLKLQLRLQPVTKSAMGLITPFNQLLQGDTFELPLKNQTLDLNQD
ncbi:NACHT, LRR and PYD domains-containing protein 12-like [Lissotriton helveticus]